MKCPQCGGEGILRTGIAEASTTVCDFCDGAGTLRPKIEAHRHDLIRHLNGALMNSMGQDFEIRADFVRELIEFLEGGKA